MESRNVVRKIRSGEEFSVLTYRLKYYGPRCPQTCLDHPVKTPLKGGPSDPVPSSKFAGFPRKNVQISLTTFNGRWADKPKRRNPIRFIRLNNVFF